LSIDPFETDKHEKSARLEVQQITCCHWMEMIGHLSKIEFL